MNIEVCVDGREAAKRAGEALSKKVRDAELPVLLLLSGGSALQILDWVDAALFTENVTIGVLDERVSADPAVNNYLQLLAHIPVPSVSSINTVVTEGESPEMLADRFERALRDWKTKNPDGKIIATIGMGPDGHTFGMMPARHSDAEVSAGEPATAKDFDKLFVHTDRWVAGYDVGDKNQFPLRATTTVAFSKMIDTSIWYVCGAGKREMLVRALDPATLVYDVPARIMQDMADVTLFTDISISQ